MTLRAQILAREHELETKANALVRSVVAVVNGSEPALAREIRSRFAMLADGGQVNTASIESGINAVKASLFNAYTQAGNKMRAGLALIGEREIEAQKQILEPALKREVKVPTQGVVASIVNEQAFRGGRLTDWLLRLETNAAYRVTGAIRIGLSAREPIEQIVRRVIGTKAKRYSDGVMETGRNEIDKTIRMAVRHVTGKVRAEVWRANLRKAA